MNSIERAEARYRVPLSIETITESFQDDLDAGIVPSKALIGAFVFCHTHAFWAVPGKEHLCTVESLDSIEAAKARVKEAEKLIEPFVLDRFPDIGQQDQDWLIMMLTDQYRRCHEMIVKNFDIDKHKDK